MRSLLRNRNFARLFAGRPVTNVGDSVYYIAAMWLVYALTGDPLYSGVAGFPTVGPAALQFLFGPLAAALDALSALPVLAVMPTLALLNQLVYPAQTAALPRIVDDDELVSANSAFSLAYQGTETVFNAVGGALVASRLENRPFGRVSVACLSVSSVLWVGSIAVEPFPATVALFGLAFVPVGVVNVLLAALVQSGVPEGMVGRVSSVLGSASQVATPVGSLAGGAVAGAIGPAVVLAAGGAFMGLFALYWAAVPSLRRIPPVDEVALAGPTGG
jgi:hypothetical protein